MARLIVKNAVKEAVRECNVSSDFYDKLDQRVQKLVREAERRAQENNRRTVQARDL